MRIRGVLFDFDDTLTMVGELDYLKIREDIGCPREESILSFIERIENPQDRRIAHEILLNHELSAAARARPADGAESLVSWLEQAKIYRGIITRNTRRAVDISFQNFNSIDSSNFNIILTRDDDMPVKPEPDGVLHVCETLGIQAVELLVVGDYIYDVEAGNAAGAVTVFLDSRPERTFDLPPSTYTIMNISEIQGIIGNHI